MTDGKITLTARNQTDGTVEHRLVFMTLEGKPNAIPSQNDKIGTVTVTITESATQG